MLNKEAAITIFLAYEPNGNQIIDPPHKKQIINYYNNTTLSGHSKYIQISLPYNHEHIDHPHTKGDNTRDNV